MQKLKYWYCPLCKTNYTAPHKQSVCLRCAQAEAARNVVEALQDDRTQTAIFELVVLVRLGEAYK